MLSLCQASVGPVLSKVLVLFHKWMHLGILTGALSYLMAKPSLAQKEGIALGQLSNEGSPAPGKMVPPIYVPCGIPFIYLILNLFFSHTLRPDYSFPTLTFLSNVESSSPV